MGEPQGGTLMDGAGRRRIYLMRHGHVDYFSPELTDPRVVRLTDDRRAQADAARVALSGIEFDLAIHSGLPRTIETASIVLSGRYNAPAMRSVAGLEELKSGWLRAASREELAARLAFAFDAADEPDAKFMPDGENFASAELRIVAALNLLIAGDNWRRALIVAHEGVNRIVLGWACGGGLASIGAFEQDLGCINVIDLDLTPAPPSTAPDSGLAIERAIIKAMNVTPYDYLKAGLPKTSLEHLFDVDFGRARPLPDVAAGKNSVAS